MSFAWPYLLWLLLVPLALVSWEFSRRRRIAANVHPKMLRAEAEFNRLALVQRPPSNRRARLWFYLGLAFGLVALARPQWGRIEEQVFDQSREILIAVDLSRSMQAQDVKPSRLDRAKLLIQSLLERLEGERVGLVVFSGTAFLQSPLSADYEILREFLPALGPDYLPEGGTNYRALLETALSAFGSSSSADRFLVILSDGEATDDDWKDATAELTKKGIRVIGLGVGTAAGAMIPDGAGAFVKDERGAVVLSKLENGTLQQLAQATSGIYRDASGWIDLAALVQETVEAGRKGSFVEKNQVRLVERFQWALAPALLCLLLSFWREFPVMPKPREIELGSNSSATPPLLPTKPRSSAVVSSIALLGLLSVLAGRAPSVRAAETPTAPEPAAETVVAPLSNLTKELSAHSTLQAGDWNRFASATLDYAERRTRAQEPVAPKAITDAIEAVDAGQALDPKLTDWAASRKKLEEYLEKKDPPPPKPPEQKKDEQKDQDQKQKEDQQKQDQQKQDQKKQDQQKQDQSKQADQKKDDASSKPDSKPSDENGKQDGKQDQKSAFGDMKDQPPPQPQPQQSNETQKVGGTPEKKANEAKNADPNLALPLQKLDQLKNSDSPAKLYQLMEGERKSDPKKKGKDW